jgi:hypothetical protein
MRIGACSVRFSIPFTSRFRSAAIYAISVHLELVPDDLERFRHTIQLIHRAIDEWNRLLAGQAEQMMMVLMALTVNSEFDAIFKNKLFQYTHLMHNPQIAIDRIEAQAVIELIHMLVHIFRRQVTVRICEQLGQRFALIGNPHPLLGHELQNLLGSHLSFPSAKFPLMMQEKSLGVNERLPYTPLAAAGGRFIYC